MGKLRTKSAFSGPQITRWRSAGPQVRSPHFTNAPSRLVRPPASGAFMSNIVSHLLILTRPDPSPHPDTTLSNHVPNLYRTRHALGASVYVC